MSRDANDQGAVYRPETLEAVETGDGSRTLYDPERDAHFSSLHGARTESRHIFLEGTRLVEKSETWRVLELGFGAGINFRETAKQFSESDAERLRYHAVDYAPVRPEDLPFRRGAFVETVRRALGSVSVEGRERSTVEVSEGAVALALHPIRWCELALDSFAADALFYDPFDPKREPDSWTAECFRTARDHLAPAGILGTYSAASDVKRAMFAADLSVATAPGPGPKREITFAARSEEPLQSIPDAELLSRSRYLDSSDD